MPGLIGWCSQLQVRDHFNRLYNLYATDWTYNSSLSRCFLRRKRTPRRRFLPDVPIRLAKAGPLARVEDVEHLQAQVYADPDVARRRRRQPADRVLYDEDVYPVLGRCMTN